MFVCLCLGVTDREIDAALVAGARAVDQVGRFCGAGTCCGGCRPEIARMIAERCPARVVDRLYQSRSGAGA